MPGGKRAGAGRPKGSLSGPVTGGDGKLGRPGKHGRPIGSRHQQDVRDKIQASQIITRLTNHILGKLKKPMDSSQVTAALGLLRKKLPDLSKTEVTGHVTLEQLVMEAQRVNQAKGDDEQAPEVVH
jgi:hypothetical protein